MKKNENRTNLMQKISNLGKDESGLSTVEYVILLVLIVVVSITVWNKFGTAVKDKVGQGTEDIENMGQ